MHRSLTFALALLAALAAGGTGFAKPDDGRHSPARGFAERYAEPERRGGGNPWERRAENGRRKADELPLSQILRRIQQSEGGQAEQIQYADGRYVIMWRYPDGRLQRLIADARTGRVSQGR
ncbi:MAG: hypothetical protein TEF_18200 [Rhizobiales bacterium NRL2]|nr:MAG: hypothetical protein TEF_18200 [Rhizobiales bacterium NRL2]